MRACPLDFFCMLFSAFLCIHIRRGLSIPLHVHRYRGHQRFIPFTTLYIYCIPVSKALQTFLLSTGWRVLTGRVQQTDIRRRGIQKSVL